MNACTREAYRTLAAGYSEQAALADAYEAATKADKMPHVEALSEASRVVREAPPLEEIRALLRAERSVAWIWPWTQGQGRPVA